MGSLSVLFIDDEEELVQTLVERLELRGIDARGLSSGQEAIDCVAAEAFDVVLLDVKMPGVGGLEVLARLKELRPEQKVIMLTGHGSSRDAENGRALGAHDYLMKPVNFDDLLALLHEATGKKGPLAESPEERSGVS